MQQTQLLLTLAAASSLTSARQIPPHCTGLDRSPPCTKWTGAAAVKIEAQAESGKQTATTLSLNQYKATRA